MSLWETLTKPRGPLAMDAADRDLKQELERRGVQLGHYSVMANVIAALVGLGILAMWYLDVGPWDLFMP